MIAVVAAAIRWRAEEERLLVESPVAKAANNASSANIPPAPDPGSESDPDPSVVVGVESLEDFKLLGKKIEIELSLNKSQWKIIWKGRGFYFFGEM